MLSTATTVLVSAALLWPWFLLLRRRPDVAAAVLVGIAVFSTWALELLFRVGMPAGAVRGLIPVKDVLAVSAVALLLWWRRERTVAWPLALALGVVAVRGLVDMVSSGPSLELVFSARNLAEPLLGLAIGLLLTAQERGWFLRAMAWTIAVGAGVSLVEYLLPARWWYQDLLRVPAFWTEVKQQPQFLWPFPDAGTLPGNFYTALLGGGARRLAGPFGEPLAAGYLLGVGVVAVVWTERHWRRLALLGVTGAALLLTFTRAGWLIAAAALVPWAVWVVRAQRGTRRWAYAGVAVLSVLAVLVAVPGVRRYVGEVFSGQNSSTSGHLSSLEQLVRFHYSLLGTGLGSSGAAVGLGNESVLATMVLQLGALLGLGYLVGTVALLWFARTRWVGGQAVVTYVLLLGCVAAAWFTSEQWITYNAGLPFALLLGAGVRSAARDEDGAGPRRAAVQRELA